MSGVWLDRRARAGVSGACMVAPVGQQGRECAMRWKRGRARSCIGFLCALAPESGSVAGVSGSFHFRDGQASAVDAVASDPVAVKRLNAVEVFATGIALAAVAGQLRRAHAAAFGAVASINARISSARQAVMRSPSARVGCG